MVTILKYQLFIMNNNSGLLEEITKVWGRPQSKFTWKPGTVFLDDAGAVLDMQK